MWDEIVEIIEIGEMETMDIEVSGDHLFFANDVLVHNSALQLESMDDLSQANIAGGISKVNTCDNLVAIMQSAQMKARGEMRYTLLKTRSSNGVGNSFMLNFNSNSLRLENQDEGEQGNQSSRTLSSFIASKKKPDDSLLPVSNNPQNRPNSGLDVKNLPFQI